MKNHASKPTSREIIKKWQQKRKLLITFFLLLVLILITGYWVLQLSNSRTFQFFGELVYHVNTDKKVVALTFDDAPTKYTEEVLKTLTDKKVKATFFVIGKELEHHAQIGKDIVSLGNELGNHSYSHERMIFKAPSFIAGEIEKTNQLIRNTGYKGEITFRPPNGKKLIVLPWYLHQHNIKTIMWDVEPDTYGNTSDFFVKYTMENTKPGSIILLHPFCNACESERDAIGKIIDGLQAKDYKFVTISELLTYQKN